MIIFKSYFNMSLYSNWSLFSKKYERKFNRYMYRKNKVEDFVSSIKSKPEVLDELRLLTKQQQVNNILYLFNHVPERIAEYDDYYVCKVYMSISDMHEFSDIMSVLSGKEVKYDNYSSDHLIWMEK